MRRNKKTGSPVFSCDWKEERAHDCDAKVFTNCDTQVHPNVCLRLPLRTGTHVFHFVILPQPTACWRAFIDFLKFAQNENATNSSGACHAQTQGTWMMFELHILVSTIGLSSLKVGLVTVLLVVEHFGMPETPPHHHRHTTFILRKSSSPQTRSNYTVQGCASDLRTCWVQTKTSDTFPEILGT